MDGAMASAGDADEVLFVDPAWLAAKASHSRAGLARPPQV